MDTVTFSFTEAEYNLLMAGLGELPAKHSHGLINRLLTEAQQQKRTAQQPMSSSEFEHVMAQKQQPLNSGAGVVAS
jgi:hypothetical protein